MIIFPGRKLLDINILSINIIRQNQDFLDTESYVFEFQYQQMLKYLDSSFINGTKRICFTMIHYFFAQISIFFFLIYGLVFLISTIMQW